MRRAALITATVCVATSAALLLAEIAMRVIGGRPPIVSEWILGRPELLDGEVLFCDPDYRRDGYYQVSGRPLVAFLGDSFTRGHPVARKDSYPAVLMERLAGLGRAASGITLGIGDGGPDQELRLFERHMLPRVKPDVVVWQLYPNDAYDNVSKAVYAIDAGRLAPLDVSDNWLMRRQHLYDQVPSRDLLRRGSWVFRSLLKSFERSQLAALPEAYRDDPRRWGLEKIRLEVARMRELAQRHGFKVYFLLVAPQSLYLTPEVVREPAHQRFLGAYRSLGELLARQPTFLEARLCESDGVTLRSDVFVDGARDSNGEGARHFNETGYRLLAELVLGRLTADRVLD